MTFNYARRFADFLNNFTFGRGVHFGSPKATEAITPRLLDRVWTVDNEKGRVLWEMGNQGGVSGDCFVKVAYEEPWISGQRYDPVTGEMVPEATVLQQEHPGRVRILVLNSSFCFPEFHPHDKDRLLRFKLKYKFFGTSAEGTRQVFTYTELITDDVIEEYINDQLIEGSPRPNPLGRIPVAFAPNNQVSGSPWGLSDIHDVISLNREYNEKATDISDIINYHCVDEKTEILTARGWLRYSDLSLDDRALCLDPVSNEVVWGAIDSVNQFDYDGELVQWSNHIDALTTPGHRWLVERRTGRDRRYARDFATTDEGERYTTVPTLQQGSRIVVGGGVPTHFPTEAKYTDEFVETVGWWVTEGSVVHARSGTRHGVLAQSARVNPSYVDEIRRLAAYWRSGGHRFTERPSVTASGCVTWYLGSSVVDVLDEAGVSKQLTPEFLCSLTYTQAVRLRQVLLMADGCRRRGRDIWYQDDVSRKSAFQMLSAMLGLRTRAYVNTRGDGVVDTYRRHTLLAEHTTGTKVAYHGVVWCPTTSTGTWLARRNGNVFWTGNSAPVTVITGAKAQQLEKGPKKVWSGLPKDAQVFNLELGANLAGPLEYMRLLKTAMHEMTGVHETAFGQMQPISNTSGVALAIQYLPLMQVYHQKRIQYEHLIKQINELVMLTLAVKEPLALRYDPSDQEAPLRPGQLEILDPSDPLTYQSTVYWPPPLPYDVLAKLNEEMAKMQMGVQSKRGALRELGEAFPDEKMQEIFAELIEDMEDQGALDLKRAAIQRAIMELTGMTPSGDPAMPGEPGGPPQQQSAGGPGVSSAGGSGDVTQVAPPEMSPAMLAVAGIEQDAQNRVLSELVTRAMGTKIPQRRNPQNGTPD